MSRRGAEAWLADVLAKAHAETLPRMVRTGVTFARAAEASLDCVEAARRRAPVSPQRRARSFQAPGAR